MIHIRSKCLHHEYINVPRLILLILRMETRSKKGMKTRSHEAGNTNNKNEPIEKQEKRRKFFDIKPNRKNRLFYHNMRFPEATKTKSRDFKEKVKIGRQVVPMRIIKWDNDKIWSSARAVYIIRKPLGDIHEVPKEQSAELKQIVEAITRTSIELFKLRAEYVTETTISDVVAKRIMEREGEIRKSESNACRAKINRIIKEFEHSTLVFCENQKEIRINEAVSVFQTMSQRRPLNREAVFNYISRNYVREDAALPSHIKLKKLEKRFTFTCMCEGGKCGSTCPCATIHNIFSNDGTIKDPKFRRHYSCSEQCSCGCKCPYSFPLPPSNGVQVFSHDIAAKGCSVRSLIFFDQGETVMEMRGHFVDTDKLEPDDRYSIDVTNAGEESEFKTFYELYRRLPASSCFESLLNEKYIKLFMEAIETPMSLDPRQFGNEGRFAACSCFPNMKINLVYTNGINPINMRILMTAIRPIYPYDELSFNYSNEYVYQQLGQKCECKSLICIRNLDLFPFITDKQKFDFVRKLYEEPIESYRKNVIQHCDAEEARENLKRPRSTRKIFLSSRRFSF